MTKKQIILAAYVGGVNEHTLWEHPDAGSQIEFSTFKHVAQKAEAGKLDYFFLAEGIALRSRPSRSTSGLSARSTPPSTSRTSSLGSSRASTICPVAARVGTW